MKLQNASVITAAILTLTVIALLVVLVFVITDNNPSALVSAARNPMSPLMTASGHMIPAASRSRYPMSAEEITQCHKMELELNATCGDSEHIPPFIPLLWDNEEYVRFSNCYCYAFVDLASGLPDRWREKEKRNLIANRWDHKVQPGQLAQHDRASLTRKEITQSIIVPLVLQDHPTAIFTEDLHAQPPCDRWAVLLMIDPFVDYHFVRQGRHFYSHKPGSSRVTIVDAQGNMIFNPLSANWNYSHKKGPCYKLVGWFFVNRDTNSYLNSTQEDTQYPAEDTIHMIKQATVIY